MNFDSQAVFFFFRGDIQKINKHMDTTHKSHPFGWMIFQGKTAGQFSRIDPMARGHDGILEQPVSALECGHVYHRKCISSWMNQSRGAGHLQLDDKHIVKRCKKHREMVLPFLERDFSVEFSTSKIKPPGECPQCKQVSYQLRALHFDQDPLGPQLTWPLLLIF